MAQWIYGKNAVMQILKSKKKVEKALVAEGAKSVSYTHLDVYKRQVYSRSTYAA